MDKDEPIIIERTANGYQVRQMSGAGVMARIEDILVFQMMGYASGPGEYIRTEETLLGFIADHFSEGQLAKKGV